MAEFLESGADAEMPAVLRLVVGSGRAVRSAMLSAERRAGGRAVAGVLVRCAVALLLVAACCVLVGLAGLLIGHGQLWSKVCGYALVVAGILLVVGAFVATIEAIRERVGESSAGLYAIGCGLALVLGIVLTVASARAIGPAYQMRYGRPVRVIAEEYRCVPRSSDESDGCDDQRRLVASATERDLGWWPSCGYDPAAEERAQLRVDPTGWFATYQDCSGGENTRANGVVSGPVYVVVVLALWLCWYVVASACRWLWRLVRGGWARCPTS